MCLCQPGRAETKGIRATDLVKKVFPHGSLIGEITINLCLTDRKEDIVFHGEH
jgi:hypothetical protein